jgi:hypothetical protein
MGCTMERALDGNVPNRSVEHNEDALKSPHSKCFLVASGRVCNAEPRRPPNDRRLYETAAGLV